MKIMNTKRRLARFLGVLVALCLVGSLGTPVLAAAPPQMNHAFYGDVTSGDEPLSEQVLAEGVLVEAKINGELRASTTVGLDSRYGWESEFEVLAEEASADDPIEFYVNGVQAALYDVKTGVWLESESYPFEIGGYTELNLEVPDTTNPEVTIDDVVDYVNVLAQISGTASDNAALDKVQVSIENTTDSVFWDGTDWPSATEVWLDATGTETWTYTMPALTSDKSYQVRAKALDTSTNESTVASDSFTFDTTAPTVGITIDDPVNLANEASVPVTITSNEDGAYSYVISDGVIELTGAGDITAVAAVELSPDLSTLADGAITADASVEDAAGNTGDATQDTATKDTVAPSVTIDALTTPTNVDTQPLTGTMEEGATVELTSDEATFGDVSYDTTTWSCEVTLVEGSNVITATATDAAGNEGTDEATIDLDTAAPTVVIESTASDPTNTSPIPVTATFIEDVIGFEVGDITVGNGTADNFVEESGAVYNFDVNPADQGEVTVDIAAGVAEDAAGNPNEAATQFSITYDSLAPAVAIDAVTTPTNEDTQPLTGTMEEGATVELTSDEATFGDVSYDTTTWNCEVTLVEGLNVITATATDAAGNEGTDEATIELIDTTPPTVESTTPEADVTDVAINVVVSATFSEDIQAGDNFAGIAISGATGVSTSIDGATLTIAHDAFDYETLYTVTIPAGAINDLADNPLAGEKVWSFTTGVLVQYQLTVMSSTDGGSVTIPGEGTSTYDAGTEVSLLAVADEGYEFIDWTGDTDTIDNVIAADTVIIMTGNYEITGNFALIGVTYSLTVASSDGGSVTEPGEGTSTYNADTVVNLVAVPEEDYTFGWWSGDVVADANAASTTITMDSAKSIVANFVVFSAPENVSVTDMDPGVESVTVTIEPVEELDDTGMPAGIDPQEAYVVEPAGTGSFTLIFTDIEDASDIRVYKVVDSTWTLLEVTVIPTTTIEVTMDCADPTIVFALPPPTIGTIILPGGWNLLSTPILLDADSDSLGQMFGTDVDNIEISYSWDAIIEDWVQVLTDYELLPLYAIYIKVSSGASATAEFIPSGELSEPPSRELQQGLNLIGPAPALEAGVFPDTPLDEALVSIETAGKYYGYCMVVSPAHNQPDWTYSRGGDIENLLTFNGYWVVMDNADTMYGFSTTPISP